MGHRCRPAVGGPAAGGRGALAPHVARDSPKIASRHLEALLDSVGRFVPGEALRNIVDKDQWD